MILFDRVSFRYNENQETSFVLKEVSFSLKEGIINGLLGANGSGKSTIARLIVELLEPSDGNIIFEARENNNIYFSGMIFQNPENQIVGTTIGDDIAFGLENLNLSTEEIQQRVVKYASLFNFSDKLDFPVEKLSGGQKQMLCIASVLALEPNWIIFDEPTAHLDAWARKDFWKTLENLKKDSNIGIIVISQLPEDILHFDNVLIIEKGKVLFNNNLSDFQKNNNITNKIALPGSWQLEKIKNN